MKMKTAVSVFTVLIMLSVLFVPVIQSEETAAASDDLITIRGLAIYNGQPLDDETVTAYLIVGFVINGKGYYKEDPTQYSSPMELRTDDEGKQYNFSFEVPRTLKSNEDYYLCVENTYKIQSVSTFMSSEPLILSRDMSVEWDSNPGDYTAYMIRDIFNGTAEKPVTQTEFYITATEESSTNKITLSPARVKVTGTVGFTDSHGVYKALHNAQVELIRTSNEFSTFTDTTDRDGEFSINNVPTGDYTMKVTLGGYTEYTTTISVQENSLNEFTANIIPETSTSFFGMDFPHMLMSIAGVVGVIVLITSLVLQYRVRKGSKELVLNDMEDQDGQA